MMSFTKQLPKEMLFFFSRFKIGDTVEVSYRSDQDYQGSYKQIKIIGEIDGITQSLFPALFPPCFGESPLQILSEVCHLKEVRKG